MNPTEINNNDKHYKIKKFLKKFKYAFNGIFYGIVNDSSFKAHFITAILVIFFSFIFRISEVEMMFVLSAIFFVLATELINTSIEKSIDLSTQDIKNDARISKDAAAGAALLACIYSVIIGIIIFGPKIYELIIKK